MNKRQILASLNKIANELDNNRLYKEANSVTEIMNRLAVDMSYLDPEKRAQMYEPEKPHIDKMENTKKLLKKFTNIVDENLHESSEIPGDRPLGLRNVNGEFVFYDKQTRGRIKEYEDIAGLFYYYCKLLSRDTSEDFQAFVKFANFCMENEGYIKLLGQGNMLPERGNVDDQIKNNLNSIFMDLKNYK